MFRISGGRADAAEEDVLHGRVDVHLTAAAAVATAAAAAAAAAAAGAAAAQSCHLSFPNGNHPSNHIVSDTLVHLFYLSFPFVNISHVFSAVLYVYAFQKYATMTKIYVTFHVFLCHHSHTHTQNKIPQRQKFALPS